MENTNNIAYLYRGLCGYWWQTCVLQVFIIIGMHGHQGISSQPAHMLGLVKARLLLFDWTGSFAPASSRAPSGRPTSPANRCAHGICLGQWRAPYCGARLSTGCDPTPPRELSVKPLMSHFTAEEWINYPPISLRTRSVSTPRMNKSSR
eukprot:2771526-Pyramimonas_sp.AAC.4